MKRVVQEEATGCGIASVATLARVTYREAQDVAKGMGISAADPCLWSTTGYVRRLLIHYGIRTSTGESPFTSWERLPPVALLAIKSYRSAGHEFWHWVVFHRGLKGPVVLDSKRTLRRGERTDFGRMKPKWFIAVAVRKPLKLKKTARQGKRGEGRPHGRASGGRTSGRSHKNVAPIV